LEIIFIRVIFKGFMERIRIKRRGDYARVRLAIGEIIFVKGRVVGVMRRRVRFWRICRSLVLMWRWVSWGFSESM
jgi:hypothetical protein